MKGNIVFQEINQKAFYFAFRYYLDRRQQQNLFVLLLFTLRNFWRGGAYHLRGPYIRDD